MTRFLSDKRDNETAYEGFCDTLNYEGHLAVAPVKDEQQRIEGHDTFKFIYPVRKGKGPKDTEH